MKLTSKILFTIPFMVQVFFTVTIAFPTSFSWLYPDMTKYHILIITNGIFQYSIVGILIGKVWRMNNLARKQKWNWTWFFVFLGNIAILFFVWGKSSYLETTNDHTVQN